MRKIKSTVKLDHPKINRILVPVDFSECSSNAIRKAIFMSKMFMAKMELIHVITPIYLGTNEALIPVGDSFYSRLLKSADKNLKKIAQDINKNEGITVTTKTSLNAVHTAILEHARKMKADIIVMGTHGTSGIKEFFAGSNAYRVVSESKCPVITVQRKLNSKGFKTIILPIRAEINSRQKVGLVATLAKANMAKVIITPFANDEDDIVKAKKYAVQVEGFLKKEAIDCKITLVKDKNFTKAMIKHAEKNKADLIAVMSHHSFSLDQLIKGPFAQQFVNHSKIPVISVPDTLEFEYTYTSPLIGG